jgi:predicted NBD/HSP70 family sugar kinase
MTDPGTLPTYVPEQIAHYLGDELLTHPALHFDPAAAAASLDEPREVIALDIGGDKLRRATYAIGSGELTLQEQEIHQGRGGAGYLAHLERYAAEARERGVPVGISSATRLEGSVITRTVNLPVFFEELQQRYRANYRALFPASSFVANDTVSGICGASTLLTQQGIDSSRAVFVICASGLGASVLHEGTAIHVEIAHVPIEDRLNPFGQAMLCGVPGKPYVCVERVAAARAGIEDLYHQQTGELRDGVAIGKLYEAGDPLATALYETSALAVAHATAGVMRRYGFEDGTPVVYHGGNFELRCYREAIGRALREMPGAQPRVVFSRDLSPNACLEGAAIGAAWQPV